ncbi:hypothetical protein ARGLB_075_00090 [Arthrobacter globiformis NBRC 12137]|uniref:DUF202 domain-containing protein n=1 Tax=Arthrobacter globiformis (strain ATCC 8010 / DSM 20124 / JCM 1332 / NBRC 12137 / NCIMB 8907 / NRRL B-2979 / 168) TaxID=1077972 RepID=H0QPH6_ARTG1|nr:DUF202 domain-containing protein [Arthrobacter globiformis]GAB14727.1 hypothetical protein ARGLB_075_00090 [Arthrobacter globiformis NBRC 12137]
MADAGIRNGRREGLSARILGGGNEPDPRFTLANERTFLAWIRTSLALLAGGVAVEAFMADLFGPERRYSRAAHGIRNGVMTPDIASSAALAGSVVILAALGIYSVFLLPLK